MRRLHETRTSPPPDGKAVVLFDGNCDFCTAQARRLARYAGNKVGLRSFQDEGVLDAFPGLTYEACMEEMTLVESDGRLYGGAEAFVRAMGVGHAFLGKLFFVYYFPGVRWIADQTYAWIARRRYRLLVNNPQSCRTGGCKQHHP